MGFHAHYFLSMRKYWARIPGVGLTLFCNDPSQGKMDGAGPTEHGFCICIDCICIDDTTTPRRTHASA
jgi:hypothetical protein